MTGRMAVAGLDLSLTGCGITVAPSDWDLDLGRVRRKLLHTEGGELVDRIAALADDICTWLCWVGVDLRAYEMHVWIEGSITTGRFSRADSIRSQLKLAGVVEHELRRRLQLVARTAEQSSARKLLLGWVPAKNRKQHVIESLKALTPTTWDPNEYDAFVSTNYGLHELGAPCLTGLLGEKPPRSKPSRRRNAKPNGQGVLAVAGGSR